MRLRLVIRAAIVSVLLLAVAALALWRMTWVAPSWYRPAAADDQAVSLLARAVENRIIEETHKVRPDDRPWTLRVRSEHVNAWLTSRLPRWLIHEQSLNWPEQLGPPQVRLTRAGIELALQLSPQHSPRVVVLRVLPSIEDGRLFLHFDRLGIGRVALSNYSLDDLVQFAANHGVAEELNQPQALWLLSLLRGSESLEPWGTLADNRRVHLLDVRLGEGFIDLTLQTSAPER